MSEKDKNTELGAKITKVYEEKYGGKSGDEIMIYILENIYSSLILFIYNF